jgi:SAM-dependent methyltransferase
MTAPPPIKLDSIPDVTVPLPAKRVEAPAHPIPAGALYGCRVESIDAGASLETMPACPVCGGQSARPTFAVEGLESRLLTCVGCGLGRLLPQPDPDQLRSFYPPEYYGDAGAKFSTLAELLVRVVAARRARFLCRGLSPGARVLDVGCGRGVLLSELADRGLEVHGLEVSEAAVVGADPRTRIRIAWRLAEAGYPSDWFDRVVLWHVLEHLPDPRETLDEIRRILKPGGRVVVAVPNFSSLQARWAGPDWFHLDLPRHLFHFPLPALRRLLTDCGFRCVSEHHFSLRQNPFGWVQSALNRRRSLPRNGLYTMLLRSHGPETDALDRMTRFRLRLAWWFGMPIGLGLSLVAAGLRSGATVHVVAERTP